MSVPKKIVRNQTAEERSYCGQMIQAGESYEIEWLEDRRWQTNSDVFDAIDNGDLMVSDGFSDITDPGTAKIYMQSRIPMEYPSGCAIDLDNVDQDLSGDDWNVVLGTRALWDFLVNYDLEAGDFIAPADAIYFFDLQIKVTDLSNVSFVEIAMFQRASPDDDYWFILGGAQTDITQTELQISNGTMFDMRYGERYCIKIRLTKTNPLLDCSAKISGSDDYTAWGYDFRRPISAI